MHLKTLNNQSKFEKGDKSTSVLTAYATMKTINAPACLSFCLLGSVMKHQDKIPSALIHYFVFAASSTLR